ncbi:hypothetical protein KDAU_31330 [Dictyobacter aurantiacus]|uniref:Uncharacterized protein n=1 Tax=Dictyobacter aurantiacus TaxID=1936993 RepID=A0A401ZFY8_9CHLR|nr:hypothetical protein KDAU_31330 [Dictyobacter aurantiacus]
MKNYLAAGTRISYACYDAYVHANVSDDDNGMSQRVMFLSLYIAGVLEKVSIAEAWI